MYMQTNGVLTSTEDKDKNIRNEAFYSLLNKQFLEFILASLIQQLNHNERVKSILKNFHKRTFDVLIKLTLQKH